MLLNGVSLPDDRTRHVAAELINSIFDVDKMLYFVAPEWWRPRLHRSRQQLGEKSEKVSSATIAGVDQSHQGDLQRLCTSASATPPSTPHPA